MTGVRPAPVAVRRVDPDPSITSAIGRHHSLPTAVADLVDNSVDAGARHVLVRILQQDRRACGLLVVDDGHGMDSPGIDAAMAYAKRRDYSHADLGHFGIGLKSASLSQADTLLVWSRRWGSPAVGRGLDRSTLDSGPMVQSFSADDADVRMATVDAGFPVETGTVVEWRDVRTFLQSPDPDEQTHWLERTIEELRTHLGLVLHRILASGRVQIRIDVLDEGTPEAGPGAARTVAALNPFGYDRSGHPRYPQELGLPMPYGTAKVVAHVWPAHGQSDAGFSLGGRSPLATQGLYVYRRDRLLQSGGWNGLVAASRDLVYARVTVDLDVPLEPRVTINPEKTGVVFDAVLSEAWHEVRGASGTTFADYLDTARSGAKEARRRNPRPVQVIEPGRGMTAALIEAFEDNATYTPGEDPVDVRWRGLQADEVFRIDREARTIWLNSRYRTALGGSGGLANDDAQVVKALLHLLLGEHVGGSYTGQRERRIEAAWHSILLAAVHEQQRAIDRQRAGNVGATDQEIS
jgi:hypothetical protein